MEVELRLYADLDARLRPGGLSFIVASSAFVDGRNLLEDRLRDIFGGKPYAIDLFPTFAAAVGADIVPKDRAIDGVNQLPFLEGKQAKSNRDSVLLFTNADLRAVKWHDWKLHYVYQPEASAPPVPPLMRLFNLLTDPREESDVKDANPWAQSVMDKIVADFEATTARYPHVPPNAPDPYVPIKK